MLEFLEILDLWKRLYEKELHNVCKRYDLHKMDVDILLFLANHPQCQNATDIVQRRKLTKSHVSTSLKFLEEQGLSLIHISLSYYQYECFTTTGKN